MACGPRAQAADQSPPYYFAMRAGLKDAQDGKQPHGWLVLTDPANRRQLLREAWDEVGKVFIAALAVDFVYQALEFRWIYLEEAVTVACKLALLPYLLLRGLANRIARRWIHAGEST